MMTVEEKPPEKISVTETDIIKCIDSDVIVAAAMLVSELISNSTGINYKIKSSFSRFF
ncbi:MAG: hypothetical protein IJO68_00175 [Clostridia bacterium]|nr:hypothetical protein [Clostridia bacterium]